MLVYVVVLVAASSGCGSVDERSPSPPALSATTEPPTPPEEDARIRAARVRASGGEVREAAIALRALVREDGAVGPAARLALVEVWLGHEASVVARGPEDAYACMAPSEPAPAGGPARTYARPPALGARDSARAELRCAEAAGADVSVARGRIDALAGREVEYCAARGERPMDGRLWLLGTGGDPCTAPVPALDQRLGVPRPSSPFEGVLDDALLGLPTE